MFEGKVLIADSQLNLDLTLLGGQSFRWQKVTSISGDTEWRGVAYSALWTLTQTSNALLYKVYPAKSIFTSECLNASYFQKLIERYFNVGFDLASNIEQWKEAHEHFAQIAPFIKSVRVLHQEIFENILSFICSQNNNIKRIGTMINWLCTQYGTYIGNFYGCDEFTFPTLETLTKQQHKLECQLREAKFGYRAKFISQTVLKIGELHGEVWFNELRNLPYEQARLELVKLPGIGFKVADCICLMSLNHLQSVPIDTHIFKIAQIFYMPYLSNIKFITPSIYEKISKHFRSVYGTYAGWAQTVLFCSRLQQLQKKKSIKRARTVKTSLVDKLM